MWTLSSLQLHPHPMIVVDEDATLELQVKTVKYFKSIEAVATSQGFEQILPSAIRTGARTKALQPLNQLQGVKESDGEGEGNVSSPTIQHPQPTTSRYLKAPSPAMEYPVRSTTPELVVDNMASRLKTTPVSSPSEATKFGQQMGNAVGAVGA